MQQDSQWENNHGQEKANEQIGKRYSDLYSRGSTISNAMLESIEHLPIMEELEEIPSLVEVSNAMDNLPTDKASRHPS